jgi:hypothetical protein
MLLAFAQLNPKSATFAITLFNIAKKQLDNSPYLKNSLAYLKSKDSPLAQELHKRLVVS